MNQRLFGKTGWKISEVGFGCWGMGGGWGIRRDDDARKGIRAAFDAGYNFFDTAYVYGQGVSEQILGSVVKDFPRESYYVATKIPSKTMEWPVRPNSLLDACFPDKWITHCTETSLKRLGMERVDLQQFHVWTDAWVDRDEWKQSVEKLKKQGKIRAFGVSVNDHQPQSVLKLVETGLIDSIQVIYNIFDQVPAAELLPLCEKHRVAVIVRVPFDEGSLTGMLTPQTIFEPDDWRSGYFKGNRLKETCTRVEKLKAFLSPETPALAQLSLKFCLSHPAVSTVIVGMRSEKHVRENASAGGVLPASVLGPLKTHAWNRNFYQGAWD